MSSPLFELLADMAKDPRKFEKYLNDVESLIAEYDLTEEQKALIRRGGDISAKFSVKGVVTLLPSLAP